MDTKVVDEVRVDMGANFVRLPAAQLAMQLASFLHGCSGDAERRSGALGSVLGGNTSDAPSWLFDLRREEVHGASSRQPISILAERNNVRWLFDSSTRLLRPALIQRSAVFS